MDTCLVPTIVGFLIVVFLVSIFKEYSMADKKDVKHLNLFPAALPTDQITIVVNKIRGIEDGRSNRDRVEAAWWIVGYGASFMPETHVTAATGAAAPLSDEDCCKHLESVAKGDKHGLIPWDLIVKKALEWFMSWLSSR